MATESEAPAPALRLVTRSRSHGVELVGGASGRAEDETLAVCSTGAWADRTITAVSPGAGAWLCLGGGPKPLTIVATRGDETFDLPADTVGCERFEFSARGGFLVTWQRADGAKFPDGSLRVWRGPACVRAFHCKQLNKGGIPATLAWSGDEKVAFHAVSNTVHVYGCDGWAQVHAIQCPNVALFAASPTDAAPYAAALFVPEKKGKPAAVKVFASVAGVFFLSSSPSHIKDS